AHYSSIKLTEKNRKKLITVPSKWVMGDVLYYPPNKFMEKKLAMELADPTEKWKEIPIELELLRHRTFEECEDVKSGTEYKTDTTSPNKVCLKRKALEDIGNKLHKKSPESTRY
uniref:Uncharacterized protein n=1 Tax=Clytia hemisphaerica TaxID=252671 RepID=A0A7M5X7K9_9CNID